MFVEWLIEEHYLRLFLGDYHVFLILRHCRSLFADRINNALLERLISSFIVIGGTRRVFVRIDSTGYKMTHASQY
jgi:hypothetical protein